MTYKEENYILDTLEDVQEFIRSPSIKQLIKETHENNIMLRQIIKYLNKEAAYAAQENDEDFGRNVLANLISNGLDINRLFNNKR